MDCRHLVGREPVPPRSPGCEECLRAGASWLQLRLCLSCGHVGCCDDSPHRHASRHFYRTGDPVIMSLEPGERWAWCYFDQSLVALPERFAAHVRV